MGSFEIPNQTYDIEDFMNKQEVKNLIKKERELYLNKANNLNIIKMWYTHEPIYEIWRFVYWLRKCEFYNKRKNIPSKIALAYCRKKKNLYGMRMSIEIHENCFGEGMLLYHGNIVVNSNAKIGKNARLHGGICIGNNGKSQLAPDIGNNVEIGYGAGIYGDVKINDGCKIGANAVVLRSSSGEKTVLLGIPAVERINKDES